MTARIEGNSYRIEFSYRRREGKNASLARNSKIEGISCCAIVSDEGAPGIVSVAAVVCSAGDNFSRRLGRGLAFQRAVRDCGALRPHAEAFAHWFAERFPDRARREKRPKFSLSLEEIAARREAGEAKRSQRARARGAANAEGFL
jgi:hypothetical protein